MLQAPSPTKATVRPASSPLCSRTVSRSARSWQGWKSSVSALTTGTRRTRPSPRAGPGRRCARRSTDACRPSTRAMSATDSRRRCRRGRRRRASGSRRARRCRPRTTTWVRSVGLSKIIATVCGPAQRLRVVRRGLELGGQVEHLGLLGRGQVVVAQEVAGHGGRPARAPRRGSPARRRGTRRRRRSVSISGGASRIRSGVGLLTMKPACERGRDDVGRRLVGEVEPDQQPLAAHLGDPRVGGQPVAQLLAERGDVLEQAVGLDRVEHGERGGAGDRVAAEGGAVVAGLEQVAGVAEGDAGADRDAAAEALGDGDDVGHDARAVWWANQAPVRRCRSAPRRARAARRARSVISPGGGR